MEELSKRILGIGEINFSGLVDSSTEIPKHHYIVRKTNCGLEIQDIECGIVCLNTESNVRKGVNTLANLIVHNAVTSIKRSGIDIYKKQFISKNAIILRKDFDDFEKSYSLKTVFKRPALRKTNGYKPYATYTVRDFFDE